MFTDPESASVLDASAPAAASDPAASAPARAASAGCNTKVIPMGSYSHSSYTSVQKSAAQPVQVLCATAWAICWLTVRHCRVWLHFCLLLSLQLMEITTKSETLNSSHAIIQTKSMKRQKFCVPPFSSIQTADLLNTHTVSSIRSRLLTCKRIQAVLHAKEQGSLHSLLPRITITEYLSTHLLPETKEHGKNAARHEI